MVSKVVKPAGRKPPNAGKGRKAGIPNKTTDLLKEAIILAAEAHGNDGEGKDGLKGYCQFLAAQEPKAFSQLLGKVLPLQVTGNDGAPLAATVNLTIGT